MVIPDLHDGYFDGVWLSDNKDGRLFVRAISGERWTIALSGVAAMNFRNLRAGNVIFELNLVSPGNLTSAQVIWAYDLSDSRKQEADRLLDQAKQKYFSAIEIVPSYGAEGVVLFQAGTILSGHALPKP